MNKETDIQKTKVAPQGTTIAPQGTKVASQGTTVSPKKTATKVSARPKTKGDKSPSQQVFKSGNEADILLTQYEGKECVMRLYKPGYGWNQEVNNALHKLDGKGYVTEILTTGTQDGRMYEIMPYYPHGSVADYDFRDKTSEIFTIILKTAMGLDALHKVHIIHKDIKPANLLVADPDCWDTVICDFGIADILSGGKVVTKQFRTPIYAAPELYNPRNIIARLDGEDLFEITPAADYYSLGMTLLCLWYGEAAFRKKEQQLAVSKLKGDIPMPKDMPDYLASIAQGLLEKEPRKRWGFKEIKELLVPEKLGDYGVRLFLNPLCDFRLNTNLDSPDYIATAPQMGKFFNDLYLWHYAGAQAPAEEPLCRLIFDSFREYDESYLETFFDSKGDFFKNIDQWVRRCIDNDYGTKKIAPHDPDQRLQFSIMKCIKGLGYTPEYRFRDTGETITTMEELKSAKGNRKAALEHGLRGWLAVHFQEDPAADFSEKESYEEALSAYVLALEECDPDVTEYRRMSYAHNRQVELSYFAKKAIRRQCVRRVIQCLLSLLLAVSACFFARHFLGQARINPAVGSGIFDHIWIFAIVGILVGIFVFSETASLLLGILGFGLVSFVVLVVVKLMIDYLMWILMAFCVAIALFALVILVLDLWRDNNALSPKEVRFDSHDAFLENLDYAFSNEVKFDSSLNAFIKGDRMYWWKDRLNRLRLCLIICASCLALALASRIFIPQATPNNTLDNEQIEEVQPLQDGKQAAS